MQHKDSCYYRVAFLTNRQKSTCIYRNTPGDVDNTIKHGYGETDIMNSFIDMVERRQSTQTWWNKGNQDRHASMMAIKRSRMNGN